VGITRRALVRDEAEARAYLEELRRALPDREILVQEYLPGTEYGVGVIGNPGGDSESEGQSEDDGAFTVLPVMEVDFGGLPEGFAPILSYESKADPGSPYYTRIGYREARIAPEPRSSLVAASTRLFERLGCRDYARFDFRTGADGTVKLLEINPNPAWCWDGKLAYMTEFAGRPYSDLLSRILTAAQTRVAR
jgi:D-alanine-D-alanine ligase